MLLNRVSAAYSEICRRMWSFCGAHSRETACLALFGVGVLLLVAGLDETASAQFTRGGSGGHRINYNDERLAQSVNAVLTYIEGTFGAMVMVAAGIGAILSSAFGQYRAALGLLVVAVGAFILRSLVGTFFNDVNIQG